MKRRNFVKQSIAGAIVAATPLALTGLVRADGGGGNTTTTNESTDFWNSTDWLGNTESTVPWESTIIVTETAPEDKSDPESCVYLPNDTRWVYVGGKCYKLAKVNAANDPDIQGMAENDRPINPECVVAVFHCEPLAGTGSPVGMNCDNLKRDGQDADGKDMLGRGFIKLKYCGYETNQN